MFFDDCSLYGNLRLLKKTPTFVGATMRKLVYISLTLLLAALVVGCGRGVDRRLVLADSLMWNAPDSSLAILNAVDRDSLTGDEPHSRD